MKVRFEDVFLDETKRGHKIQASEYLSAGKYPVIDQGQDQIAGYTNLEDGLFKDVPAIIFGDHTRIIKYIDSPFFLGADGVKVLKSKINATDYKYLFYCLQNAKIPNTGYNRHFKWLKDVYIPLPPLDEQRRIAAVLDKVSDLIAKRRAQLNKLDKLLKARFVEMFGDPVVNSCGYPRVPLGGLVEIGSSKRIFEKEYVNEGIPFYRTKEIVELSKGNQITIELFISRQRYNEIRREYGVPKAGDLLISAVGTIGVIWIVDGKNDFYFKDGNLLRVGTSKKFVPVYLKHLLETLIGAYKLEMSSGTAYAALTISALKDMLVYEVPIEEQKRFASFVEQTDKSKLTIQQSLDKLEILEKALMQEYFG